MFTIIPRSICRSNYELVRVGRVRRPQCIGRNASAAMRRPQYVGRNMSAARRVQCGRLYTYLYSALASLSVHP